MRQLCERTIDERYHGNQFIFCSLTNEAGLENLLLWYNYEKTVIVMIATSEVKEGSGRLTRNTFQDMANMIAERINETYPI